MELTSLAPGLLTIGILTIALPFLDGNTSRGRILPCGLCIFLVLRYVIWRVTETMPPFEPTFGSLWAYLFLGAELLSAASCLLFLVFLLRTRDRRDESLVNQRWVTTHRPAVDIFIATYNEEEAILDRTILAASNQDYGPVRVFVLDDGRRAWLGELCARRGVHYVTRPDNAHAKAGNMNHALGFVATLGEPAEYIAILDADFVVQPDFVRKALSLFHDPSVGCVQTPQHFFNADPLQHGFRSGTPVAGRAALLLRHAARLEGRLGRRLQLRHIVDLPPEGRRGDRRVPDGERDRGHAAVDQAAAQGMENRLSQ